MRTFTIAFVLALCGMACNMRMPKHALTGEEKLTSTFFSIDADRDTTITTPQGALLTIPAGALVASGGAGAMGTVRLEVKEAYSIADMVRAGLVTTSQGRPLSSGGMIYIHVADGQGARLRKPIKVALPTKGLQDGMKVYKGKQTDKGQIDWVDPKALNETQAAKDFAFGRAIFQSNCSPCHQVARVVTGPALAWIGEREPDKKWLYDFISNNQKVLKSGDPYACYLFDKFNKTPMNLFPDLGERGIDRVLDYIALASEQVDSTTVEDYRREFDSCAQYLHARDSLFGNLKDAERRRDSLINDNAISRYGSRIRKHMYDRLGNEPETHVLKTNKTPVTAPAHRIIYYEFSIDSYGWYNVDALVSDIPGVVNSKLTVSVKGDYSREADVFLVIPSLKIYQQGGLAHTKPGEFGFFTVDGMIPLPQGVPAFILCMGELDGQPFLGRVDWMTSRTQSLTIEPASMSKEQFNAALAGLRSQRLVIQAQDSKNADPIRVLDAAMSKADATLRGLGYIKPQFCECDCAKRDSAQ
jgi:mono/diheme cytochrome c family protein